MAAGGPFAQSNPQVSSEHSVASYQPQVPRPSSANSPKSLSGMATAGTKYANGAQIPRTLNAPGNNADALSFPLSSYSMQQGHVAERQAVDSMPPQANWSDVFDQLDNNGDGVISRKEFEEFLRSQQQLPPQTLPNLGNSQVSQSQNVVGSMQSCQAQGYVPQSMNFESMQFPTQTVVPSRLMSSQQQVPVSQPHFVATTVVGTQQAAPRTTAFATSCAPYQPSNLAMGFAPASAPQVDFTFENVPTSIQNVPPPVSAQPFYSSPLPSHQLSKSAQPMSTYQQAKVISVVPASSVPLYGASVRQPVRTVAQDSVFPDFGLRDLLPEMKDSSEFTRSCYNAPIEHLSSGMPCLLVSDHAPTPIPRDTVDVVPVAGLWSCADLFGHNSSIPPLLLHEELPPQTQTVGVARSYISVPASGEPFATHGNNHMDMIEADADPYALPQLLCAPSAFAG